METRDHGHMGTNDGRKHGSPTRGTRLGVALVAAALAAGCASPPVLELQEAREALAAARDFEADLYAPDQYDLALMNLELAQTEIEDQEQVPALGRSYDRALAFLDAAILDAGRAQALAEEIKAQVFLEAQAKIPVAQTTLDDAFDILAEARPVLSFQEAQALETRLSELAVLMNLARQLMDDGAFADASERLDVITRTAGEIDRRARFVMETAPR